MNLKKLFFKQKKEEPKIKVLLICGVSGSGKTWIERSLVLNSSDTLKFHKLPQYTTRNPRSLEEVDMNVYEFIDEAEYNAIKCNLIAKTEVNGCKYGTSKNFIESSDSQTIVNTVIVNRKGHDDIKEYLDSNSNYDVLTLEIKVTNEIKDREDRNIPEEEKELEGIADISIDNSYGNRVTHEDVINLLKSVNFI